ncbi:hypothetical protein FDZ71_08285, partial [bacterium]
LDELEKRTARIREAITGGEVPNKLSKQILQAYANLGDKTYVAVRSSGTAEDLAGASFAGQYDTFLDVRGEEAILEAVKKCWASMWTARVTAYRHNRRLEKAATGIAVVVQMMVDAEVAGVMFVGNPMNARADETVINASWGLGEVVVSGSVTPDEYVLGRDLKVKRRQMGSKELRVFRNKKAGKGTVKEAVPAKLREQFTLTDEEAGKLGEMGRKVNDYYGGLPQDIEWARKDGSFYLLQSRPITGVEFTWEEDLDIWPSIPQEEDAIWTRAAADEWWTGAVTPLFWTVRGRWITDGAASSYKPFEMGDMADMRWLKYSRGAVYYNTRMDMLMAQYSLPPSLREPMLRRLHPSQFEEALNAPFDLWRTMKMFATMELVKPAEGSQWGERGAMLFGNPSYLDALRKQRKGGELYEARRQRVKMIIPTDEQLRALGDAEIKQRIETFLQAAGKIAGGGGWAASFLYGPVFQALLEGI